VGAGGVVRDSRNALIIEGEEMVMGSVDRTELEVILFSVKLIISLRTKTSGNHIPGRIPLLVLGGLPSSIT